MKNGTITCNVIWRDLCVLSEIVDYNFDYVFKPRVYWNSSNVFAKDCVYRFPYISIYWPVEL